MGVSTPRPLCSSSLAFRYGAKPGVGAAPSRFMGQTGTLGGLGAASVGAGWMSMSLNAAEPSNTITAMPKMRKRVAPSAVFPRTACGIEICVQVPDCGKAPTRRICDS